MIAWLSSEEATLPDNGHAGALAGRGSTIEGEDGFKLEGGSSMREINRDPADIAGQLIGRNHDYPEGAALYLGTMFAPIADRDAPGKGFTHKPGDVVTVSTAKLGRLVNVMHHAHLCPRWTFGTAALMRNLARRGLIWRGASERDCFLDNRKSAISHMPILAGGHCRSL